MIRIEINGLPHCPRNRSHKPIVKGKVAMVIKTEAARSYESALAFHLQKYGMEASSFASQFDKKKQHLEAFWSYYSPNVRNKDGSYSLTSGDDDSHKVLQDVIMAFIGINDGIIVESHRKKVQGEYRVVLELFIRDNE